MAVCFEGLEACKGPISLTRLSAQTRSRTLLFLQFRRLKTSHGTPHGLSESERAGLIGREGGGATAVVEMSTLPPKWCVDASKIILSIWSSLLKPFLCSGWILWTMQRRTWAKFGNYVCSEAAFQFLLDRLLKLGSNLQLFSSKIFIKSISCQVLTIEGKRSRRLRCSRTISPTSVVLFVDLLGSESHDSSSSAYASVPAPNKTDPGTGEKWRQRQSGSEPKCAGVVGRETAGHFGRVSAAAGFVP